MLPFSLNRYLPLLLASALFTGCAGEGSDRVGFATSAGPVGDFSIPLRSVESLRFDTVVRQQYDFSCGSAALATLLRYHYGTGHDEQQVFRGMWAEGDRDQIRRLGFSLLDMKRYLHALGLRSDGFKVSLDEIADAGVPGIALVNINGYRHFVVLKGVSKNEVLVGDPSLGLKTMKRDEFTKAWNGIYFALNSELKTGRSNFNRDAQWARFSRSPSGGRFIEPLSQQALMLTAPSYRDF